MNLWRDSASSLFDLCIPGSMRTVEYLKCACYVKHAAKESIPQSQRYFLRQIEALSTWPPHKRGRGLLRIHAVMKTARQMIWGKKRTFHLPNIPSRQLSPRKRARETLPEATSRFIPWRWCCSQQLPLRNVAVQPERAGSPQANLS